MASVTAGIGRHRRTRQILPVSPPLNIIVPPHSFSHRHGYIVRSFQPAAGYARKRAVSGVWLRWRILIFILVKVAEERILVS